MLYVNIRAPERMSIKLGHLVISESVNDRGPKTTHLAVWLSENQIEYPHIFTRAELERASKRATENVGHVPKLEEPKGFWKRIFG